MNQFSQKTCETLNHYVYCLLDPRSNNIFYIGKGKDNRVFEHIKGTLKKSKKSDKLIQIKEIIASGNQIKHYIIRHNLTEIEALKVEASVIDVLRYKEFGLGVDLKNVVSGHFSLEGIEKTENIELMYAAKPIDIKKIKHKLLVININETYLEEESIYEATRKWWVINPEKAKEMDYILSEYKGVIRAIFKATRPWIRSPEHKKKARRGFEGEEILNKKILDLYLHKSIKKKKGAANPIKYLYPNYLKDIKHKLLVININKSYKTKESIYEATRKWWVINPEKANEIDYILSEYKGVTRAIFKATKPWMKSPEHKKTRRGFEGEKVLDKKILDLYLHKMVKRKKGSSNPIRYFYPKTFNK